MKELNIFNSTAFVRDALLKSTELKEKIKDKIFPLVAPEKTTFPFIVVGRTNATYNLSKDVRTDAEVNISIDILTDNYAELAELAELVDDAMDDFFNRARNRAYLVGNSEDYGDEVFHQNLDYQVKI